MAEHAVQALMHAARVRVVAAMLAQLMMMLGLLTLLPAGVALGLGSGPLYQRLGFVALALCALGLLLLRLPGVDLQRIDLQWNEALAVTALAFLLAAASMVWPMMAAGISPLDALLETASAVTTTGLTVLRGVEEIDPALLFLRAWMQWYGGLGIAVLTVALIMRHHASARRLIETTGERLSSASARQHARTVFIVYVLLSGLALAAAWAAGTAPFDALLYALASVATGGFAPADASLAPLPVAAVAVLTTVCLLSAVTLPLYARIPSQGLGVLWRDEEVRALLAATLLTTLLLMLLWIWQQGPGASMSPGMDWQTALGHSVALGVSAQTTTGFSTLEMTALSPAAQLVLMLSMTIGGCTGSAAGGLKLVRLLVLLRLVQLALRRTAIGERAVLHARVDGHILQPDMITGALQLLSLWLALLLLSWLLFLSYGYAPLPSLFEVVSAIANAGLSTGLTGTDLEPALKAVLIGDMLFGRVEILAMLVLFYPPTWIARRRKL
ncbi:Trk-type K+ transporter membrane component [Lamprobacter modestohalophilus]|uniref:Trk-type K+ transporter membrane component n=1 Tax=Lamprobacter modestohalophilus TaxID=1064514 RepID=A0A9X1B2K4_9GAMM|nr:TrkH family potassium uptake protein [Lamprobacter modestohalophilus]MBK1617503.1 Trk-type K+ transporter membrane component [Lamprobacter modestohalophilus]MCF7977889.1 TrkH family potassium uptake protein [Chromatiaceae bacterium]MCF7995619.1 TrkH family potassium uptake protein [Chromatiaceae bacterium]